MWDLGVHIFAHATVFELINTYKGNYFNSGYRCDSSSSYSYGLKKYFYTADKCSDYFRFTVKPISSPLISFLFHNTEFYLFTLKATPPVFLYHHGCLLLHWLAANHQEETSRLWMIALCSSSLPSRLQSETSTGHLNYWQAVQGEDQFVLQK